MTTPTATPPAAGTTATGTTDYRQPECRPQCKPPDCGPRRQCWPGEDDWHRAHTRIELPSERYLKAFWHTDILDVDSPNPHDRIIERRDPFLVRFRVELEGRLWRCIGGHWCFNVGFTAIGAGDDFNLSQHLPDPRVLQIPARAGTDCHRPHPPPDPRVLRIPDGTGCKTLGVERPVRVPPDTIPVGYCGT